MIPLAMVNATDLTVVLRDEPGGLARVAEVAVSAGVHLRGIAGFTGDEHGFVHALVDTSDVQAVTDAKTDDAFEVLVAPGERAMDVFHHPYAYRAVREERGPSTLVRTT